MAAPTITSIAPTQAPAAGNIHMEITGTNFKEYVPAASGLIGDDWTPSVRVLIDGVEAPYASTVDTTSIWVTVPAYTGLDELKESAFSAVDVVVQNLDEDGDPIVGEEATLEEALVYVRRALRPPTLGNSPPAKRITKHILQLFKQQILSNTTAHTNTDYSSDATITKVAELPAIAITGPGVEHDPYGRENPEQEQTVLDGSYTGLFPNATFYKYTYQVSAESGNQAELLTLMGNIDAWMQSNAYLYLTADLPSSYVVKVPLVATEPMTLRSTLGTSNLHSAMGEFALLRVPVSQLPARARIDEVEEAELEIGDLESGSFEDVSI